MKQTKLGLNVSTISQCVSHRVNLTQMYVDTLITGPVLHLLVKSSSRSFFLSYSDALTVTLFVSTYQEG
jgi:hypothetical protein